MRRLPPRSSLVPLLGFLLVPAAIQGQAQVSDGLHDAAGVNLTLEEGFGARQSGMGITFSAFQRDADAAANAPAAMNDVDDFTFSTSHAEKFGAAKFDDFAFLIPFESNSTFGLGLARYGVSDIELHPEGDDGNSALSPELFSSADYLVTAAFARRWGGLDLGFNFNLLYRQLDQDAMGMRGDAMAQYTWARRFRVATLVKGLVPSSASWESGYAEYETTDLYLGGAARFPVPYFYGDLEVAWQSEGLVQKRAKSSRRLNGSRFANPQDIMATSNLGVEFLFDFGMAVRFGVNEFAFKSPASTATFGFGYDWRHLLGLDYSFTPHPDLLASHRISLRFTPAFPNFKGRGFRKGSRLPRGTAEAPAPEAKREDGSPDRAPVSESVMPGAEGSAGPAPSVVPGGSRSPEQSKPPAKANDAQEEILEDEEEGQ